MQPTLYREPLPDDCPPDDAHEISATRIVYRLTRDILPTADDFRSQRAENPDAIYNISECRVRGVSVFDNISAAAKRTRVGRLRGFAICAVTLDDRAGRILKTSGRGHYTWWPYANFDIIANCRMVNP